MYSMAGVKGWVNAEQKGFAGVKDFKAGQFAVPDHEIEGIHLLKAGLELEDEVFEFLCLLREHTFSQLAAGSRQARPLMHSNFTTPSARYSFCIVSRKYFWTYHIASVARMTYPNRKSSHVPQSIFML